MAQINKSSDYFNTILYTGNGSTASRTGVGFEPSFLVKVEVLQTIITGLTK